MKVILPCEYLKSVRSKEKDGKPSCTYHTVLCDFETVLIRDKDDKFRCDTKMKKLLLECFVNVYNGKMFFTLVNVIDNEL